MQPLELAGLVLFLISYLYAGFRALLTPEGYREEEIRFYSKGGMKADEYIVFGAGVLAFLAVLAHVIFEGPKMGEIILYGQVVMLMLVMPFHFMDLFRSRMTSTLKKKTDKDYKSAGLRKIVISAIMIAAPFVIPG